MTPHAIDTTGKESPIDQLSWRVITSSVTTALLSIVLILAPLGSISRAAPGTAPPLKRKVLVDSEAHDTIKDLVRSGATRLASYGAFELWSATENQASSLRGRAGVAAHDSFDAIYLRGGQRVDTEPDAPSVGGPLRQTPAKGSQLWMVQFIGPIKGEWLDELRLIGLDVVIYMPNNAYVVWGDEAALVALEEAVSRSPTIQWSGAYHPAYRLAPPLQEAGERITPADWIDTTVQFYNTPSLSVSLEKLRAIGATVFRPPAPVLSFTSISLQLPAGELYAVAGWDDVFNVEPYVKPVMSDEVQDQIVAGQVTASGPDIVPTGPGYLSFLASKGFPTTPSSYPVVDVVDDGIDTGNAKGVLHPDFHEFGSLSNPDRVTYINNCTADPLGNSVGGHGNINAGIVASYNNLTGWPYADALGYRIGLGVSPYGRVAGTKVFRNTGSWDDSQCGESDQGVVAASYDSGAAMTSNSWGAPVYGAYTASSQAYDSLTRDASSSTPGNQEMLHIFAHGNRGPASGSTDSPATAKNVISVGATENVRDDGTADGNGCNVTAASSADDIIGFSSRGPTDDGRIKPDVMAPGTHIQGPASQDPAFDGSGVCGGPLNDGQYPPTYAYYPNTSDPPDQTLYTWSSGTSHSTPAVAGASGLLYEYYGRVMRPGQTPSPAMLKALVLNSARYLIGLDAKDTLPSPNQGWGDVNMGTLLDGRPNHLLDQSILLDETGQVYDFDGMVHDSGAPFRVSLVWTDAPGSTTGAAYVNDLDLEVSVGGDTYKGNVFSGQYSVTGGSFDQKNNVENVFLPSGTSGAFAARVIARNIAGDGVPGNSDTTDQDFALVIHNAAPPSLLEPAGESWYKVSGVLNGIVDPGDTIGLAIDVRNIGTATATGMSGVVSLTQGQATVIANASTYPDIAAGAIEQNDTPYTFEVSSDAICGADLSFRHSVTSTGGAGLGYSFVVPVGLRLPGEERNYPYAGPPVPIPDATPQPDPTPDTPGIVTVTVDVTRTGWVDDVDVRFDATHTWDGDLGIDLMSPAGTDVSLYYRSGSSGDDFTGTIFDDSASESITQGTPPYTGRFRPREPLSALHAESISGTWTLKVEDYATQDKGYITGFSLDIQALEAHCHMIPQYLPIILKNGTN